MLKNRSYQALASKLKILIILLLLIVIFLFFALTLISVKYFYGTISVYRNNDHSDEFKTVQTVYFDPKKNNDTLSFGFSRVRKDRLLNPTVAYNPDHDGLVQLMSDFTMDEDFEGYDFVDHLIRYKCVGTCRCQSENRRGAGISIVTFGFDYELVLYVLVFAIVTKYAIRRAERKMYEKCNTLLEGECPHDGIHTEVGECVEARKEDFFANGVPEGSKVTCYGHCLDPLMFPGIEYLSHCEDVTYHLKFTIGKRLDCKGEVDCVRKIIIFFLGTDTMSNFCEDNGCRSPDPYGDVFQEVVGCVVEDLKKK